MPPARHATAQRRLMRLRGWVVPWALVLLVAVQCLALLHGLVHAGGVRTGAPTSAHAPSAASLGEDLFSGHSDTDCRLFDQHAPTDLASMPVPALAFAPATPVLHTAAPDTPLAARVRAYRARDPPHLA